MGRILLGEQATPATPPAGFVTIFSKIDHVLYMLDENAVETVLATLPITDTTALVKGSADSTKLVRLEVDGLTTANTRVLTVQDKDITIAGAGANTDITSLEAVTIKAITQTNAIENTSKLLQTEDIFSDFVVVGLLPATSANLISDVSAGHAYVTGTRVNKAATSKTYTASVDTYVDISSAGVYTFPEVALGAAAPAITADSIRLAKVVTNATAVTGVTDLRVLSLVIMDRKVGIGTVPGAMVDINTAAAGTIGLKIQGVLEQTADLIEAMDNSGNLRFGVDPTGRFAAAGSNCEMGIWDRAINVTSIGQANAAGEKYVWYSFDKILRVWTNTTGDIVAATSAGNVGVRTIAPANPLAVNRQADDGVVIDIEQADAVEGTISVLTTTVSYNAFVGSHYTQLKDGQTEPPVGAVVISLGEIIPCEVTIEKEEIAEEEISKEVAFEEVIIEARAEVKKQKYVLKGEEIVTEEIIYSPAVEARTERKLKANIKLNEETGKFIKSTTIKIPISKDVSSKEYFTYVDTTKKAGDKRVYGTWFGKMSNDSHGQSFGQNDKSIYLVAQVGLFKILCTEDGGNIEIGDYLETSSHPMLAQKQTSGAKLNSTVAKALVNVNWGKEQIDPKFGCKVKLIPCIF